MLALIPVQLDRHASVRYILPFALFFVFLWLGGLVSSPAVEAPLRVLVLGVVCYFCWPSVHPVRPVLPWQSIFLGIAVFVLWIAPDLLIPHYRELWPFNNQIVGHVGSTMPPGSLSSPWVLFWRCMRAVVIVPIVEELFWRAWMMRWLIDPAFERVPLGTFRAGPFLTVAILFAAEHGPYWDVGLITGLIYNWWMVRSRSLSDCILAHAVTNACLSCYVIWAGQWQYWQ